LGAFFIYENFFEDEHELLGCRATHGKKLANIMKRKGIIDIASNAQGNGFQQIERVFFRGKEQKIPLWLSRILPNSWPHQKFHGIPDLPFHKDQGVMK